MDENTGAFDPDHSILVVKNVADSLNLNSLKMLFGHFGASNVIRRRHAVFVTFSDQAQANRAQAQLHRVQILNKILSIEKLKPLDPFASATKEDEAKEVPSNTKEKNSRPNAHLPGVNASSLATELPLPAGDRRFDRILPSSDAPIAPELGLNYPFPPHLQYAYPPPDESVLHNIQNALVAVPKFYTQVLHLMNKMNLPAPFGPIRRFQNLPTPTPAGTHAEGQVAHSPAPPPPPPRPPPDWSNSGQEGSKSETEESTSEEEEEEANEGGDSQTDEKRASDSGLRKRRKLSRQPIRTMEEAGVKVETPADTSGAPAVIKKKRPIIAINLVPKKAAKASPEVPGGSSQLDDDASGAAEESASLDSGDRATREALIGGKATEEEMAGLPALKNYSEGAPSRVLYVKNLAKAVTESDLFYVFGAFFPSFSNAKENLGIRLMQEGRMKGQAFVTFPSVDMAEEALNVVHGFKLHLKPMVIQFGKSFPV